MNEQTPNTEALLRFLDGELSPAERSSFEEKLGSDSNLQNDLESLSAAKQAVISYGTQKRIASIHTEMMKTLSQEEPKKVIRLNSILYYGMRVAALLVIIIGVTVLFQYYNASSDQLFRENYQAFQISQERGDHENNSLKKAYINGNFAAVTTGLSQISNPTAEDYFLAGNAALSLNKPEMAINNFLAVQQQNSSKNTHFYEDETSYYLAMAYLENQEPAKALPLFEGIHNDKTHTFHRKVGSWFIQKLKRLVGNK
jgi:hypothetical protein